MIYLQLLLSYLKIGFFGFGGGYAMLSLIQNEIVVQRGWLTSEQLTDIIAISQVTPGPIAINSATYVGYAVTGTVWGAALATLAACIPSLTLMLAATKFYLRLRANRYVSGAMEGMKPMMIGMIMAAALLLLTPRNLHRLEKLGDTRRRLPRFVQKDESYPHHRPLGSGRVIALSVTEPIQTILP